jgi:3-deoxy-manno-octulosonate cytidylyltransferase (CMP-KDO synthetase)
MRTLGVIPARFGSSRFPGKPLVDLCGKPMLQWVWEQAMKAKSLDAVLIATDDARIARVAKAFGAEAVMTPVSCPTGTDRIALAARGRGAGIVVNIQGDEPLLPPALIDTLVALLKKDKAASMATLAHPITDAAEFANPNAVKVVLGVDGRALYFSRAAMPFARNAPNGRGAEGPNGRLGLKHIGLYAYRASFLQAFTRLKPTPLEQLEALEQLRALEHGHAIQVGIVGRPTQAVDTPQDAAKVRKLLKTKA